MRPRSGFQGKLDQAKAWFFSHSLSSDIAWALCAIALAAILAWFFLFSGYGVPAEPVYEGF